MGKGEEKEAQKRNNEMGYVPRLLLERKGEGEAGGEEPREQEKRMCTGGNGGKRGVGNSAERFVCLIGGSGGDKRRKDEMERTNGNILRFSADLRGEKEGRGKGRESCNESQLTRT